MRRYTALRDNDNASINRWIISYADLLTLLFAFFVVLYAISSVDHEKYEAFIASTNKEIHHSRIKENYPYKVASPVFDPAEYLEMLSNNISQWEEHTRDSNQDEWMELNLDSQTLFESSSATPSKKAGSVIDKVVAQLKNRHVYITVEGHSDNKPIKTHQFASNWELSAMRAAVITNMLNERGIPSERLSSVGYADQYPIESNATEAGRIKNRRVMIIIANQKSVLRLRDPGNTAFQADKKSLIFK